MPVYKYCYKCKTNVLKGSSHKCIGGNTNKTNQHKLVYNTVKWRKLVQYCKQKYCVCSRCGGVENIILHHIFYADTHIERAFDIDNVVLLCDKCHKEVHKKCRNGELDFKFIKYFYDYTL